MERARSIPARAARGAAVFLLAVSLVGCGALNSAGKDDEASPSPAAEASSAPQEAPEPSDGGSDEGRESGDDAKTDTSPETDEGSSGAKEVQPAGNIDNPASWLANTPYVPLEGIESVTVEGLHGGSPSGNTFTLSFTFDHPNASQECKDAVTTLNEVEIPIQQMSIAKYEGTFKALDPSLAGPTIQAAAVQSNEDFNLMDEYNDILAHCANTPGEPKAVVENLPEHEGIHVQLGNADLIVAGKSHGNRHIWMILANADPTQAKVYMDAQIDLFNRSVANAT